MKAVAAQVEAGGRLGWMQEEESSKARLGVGPEAARNTGLAVGSAGQNKVLMTQWMEG